MAKHNNQKKKARPSWFQKQIERNGQDFLLRRQPLDIQREAFNIVRDICRGNITPRDFEYLFDLKVLSNVKIAVYEKYIQYHTYDSSLAYAIQSPNGTSILEKNFGVAPENLQKIFNNTRELLAAYCTVLQNLDYLIAFVQNPFPKTEEDYLKTYSTIQYKLYAFRYII